MKHKDLKIVSTTGGGGTATKAIGAFLVMQGFKIKVNLPPESQLVTIIQTVIGLKEALAASSIPKSKCSCPGPNKGTSVALAKPRPPSLEMEEEIAQFSV